MLELKIVKLTLQSLPTLPSYHFQLNKQYLVFYKLTMFSIHFCQYFPAVYYNYQ